MKTIITDEKDVRFLQLVEELDRGYYQRIGDELHKYDKYNEFTQPHTVILLLDDDEAVACASYRVFDSERVEFKRVYVKKDYRRMGIAYQLIRQLEKDVMDNGFKYSYIVTGKNNNPAIGLYEKLNYREIDKFGEFKDDEIVICMRKEF